LHVVSFVINEYDDDDDDEKEEEDQIRGGKMFF